MPDQTLEELEQTPGGKLGAKLRAENQKLKIIFAILAFVCLFYGMRLLHQDEIWQSWLYILLAYALIWMMRACMNRVHSSLNDECDPRKAEELYSYYYVKGRIAEKPETKAVYSVLFARCRALQGNEQEALRLLSEVERHRLRGRWLGIYYDVMRMCFVLGGNREALLKLRDETGEQLAGKMLWPGLKRALKQEIEYIDLFLSMEKGDLEIYRRLSSRGQWKRGPRLRMVSNRYVDAKAYLIQNNKKAAEECCRYVFEHGSRLFYAELAAEMLKEEKSRQDMRQGKTI